jgi:putative FmdB family regulatory protein
MPEFIYRCRDCGSETEVTEPMHSRIPVICVQCGGTMRRRPLKVRVNWGGMKPSKGELHPNIKSWINGAQQRREEENAN